MGIYGFKLWFKQPAARVISQWIWDGKKSNLAQIMNPQDFGYFSLDGSTSSCLEFILETCWKFLLFPLNLWILLNGEIVPLPKKIDFCGLLDSMKLG